MDQLSDSIQLISSVLIFMIFMILGFYYYSKKSNEKGLIVMFFGVIFLIASVFKLLAFILPILFLLFFLSIFTQYLRKKQLHQLIWSISLFMFFLTTLFQAIAGFNENWDQNIVRIYYVLASFQVFLLGLGELYLLSNRNIITKKSNSFVIILSSFFWMLFGFIYLKQTGESALYLVIIPSFAFLLYGFIYILLLLLKSNKFQISGYQYTNYILVFSIFLFSIFVYYAFTKPIDVLALATPQEVDFKAAWGDPSIVRAFSPIFTVNGSLFIFLGSLYSYVIWQYNIRKSQGRLNLSTGIFNIYFALGVVIFTIGGTFSHFGLFSILYTSELLGGIFMYFGFLESDKISMDMLVDIVTFRFLRKEYIKSELSAN